MYYERELSHVCGYMRELDLIFYVKEILHFYGYLEMILFRRLWATTLLDDHETHCVRKIISLSSHTYKRTSKSEVAASCALI
jgi:hypothetical protein